MALGMWVILLLYNCRLEFEGNEKCGGGGTMKDGKVFGLEVQRI
jgi:hypothetical protein